MQIGIVGLGLIGGSLAKAYTAAGATVLGADKNPEVRNAAQKENVIQGELRSAALPLCDLILLAITPDAAVLWLKANAKHLAKNNLVVDCCGTKRKVCTVGFALGERYDFSFVGGHPMAGDHKGGFAHSRQDLFLGATFVLVPPKNFEKEKLDVLKSLLFPAGFQKIVLASAEPHDKVIAFTSQMPHIVSNAFIKSQTAQSESLAVSAGSYRDFTRVAYLDPAMWTTLFLENKDNLISEIDTLVQALELYSDALKKEDANALFSLLEEGKTCKMEVDKLCNLQN